MSEAAAAHTFLFADMAGFTALTEAHGDEGAADVAAEFFEAVGAMAPEFDAEVIKTIGDAVLIRADDPSDAVRLAVRVVHEVGAQHGAPMVRIGMHTGPAVERGGDWFGGTVNLAARISSAASGGEILLSESTRVAADGLEGVEIRTHGEQRFKNVAEPVKLYAAVPARAEDTEGLAIDPVCRMAISPGSEAGRLVHEGREYRFCSLDCVRAFADAPERYTGGDE